MDKPLISLHDDKLPNRIDVVRRTSGNNHEYICTFYWDDDYSEFVKLHSPGLEEYNYVKQFAQELSDNGYSITSDQHDKRKFERGTNLPSYFAQLGLEELG